jgi:hypothetical protein
MSVLSQYYVSQFKFSSDFPDECNAPGWKNKLEGGVHGETRHGGSKTLF